MKLRIPEIEILPDDPFRNDNLERKYAVEGLTNILGSTTDPLVISVNAPWGYGKTTFLKMLHAHLLNNGFKVVRFNACDLSMELVANQAVSPGWMVSGSDQFRRTVAGGL